MWYVACGVWGVGEWALGPQSQDASPFTFPCPIPAGKTFGAVACALLHSSQWADKGCVPIIVIVCPVSVTGQWQRCLEEQAGVPCTVMCSGKAVKVGGGRWVPELGAPAPGTWGTVSLC